MPVGCPPCSGRNGDRGVRRVRRDAAPVRDAVDLALALESAAVNDSTPQAL